MLKDDPMVAALPPPDTSGLDFIYRVVEILSIIAGGVAVLFRISRAVQKMEQGQSMLAQAIASQQEEMSELKNDIKTLNRLLIDVALQKQRLDTQDERLKIMDQRYDELRRGVGLIVRNGGPPG